MKKGLKSLAVLGLSVLGLVGCGGDNSKKLVVGLVSVGDTSETYSKAHIDGINEAAKKLGAQVVLKTSVPESSAVIDSANEIVEQGASVVFTNSYGHQDYAYQFAKDNKDVTVVAATGDYAAISGLTNFKNAFTNIYEARYVSGIVGGMKLKELVDGNKLDATKNKDANGNWKIGYVGAFNYAEVVSGYTAFYLGVKAGFGADNVAMEVQYTDSWYDHDGENAAARALISHGNVIIGQHADSTGAPEAIEDAHKKGEEVYSVGYNVDMLSAAPTAALTSATNNWGKYYEYAIDAAIKGETIATDWAKGYNDDAVAITKLGPSVAAGTAEAVAKAEADIKAGKLHVFDTSKFTVAGEHLTTNMVDFSYMDWSTNPPSVVHQGATKETIKTDTYGTYVEESVERSAPYFSLRIDGITEVAKAAKN